MISYTKAPGTGTSSALAGTVLWATPTRLVSSNDQYATCGPTAGQTSIMLIATQFGFSIPLWLVPVGFQVRIEAKASVADAIKLQSLKLGKATNALPAGSSFHTTAYLGTSDATVTYGSPSEKSGLSWTPQEVNAAGFSVWMQFACDVTANVSVDYVEVVAWCMSRTGRRGILRSRVR